MMTRAALRRLSEDVGTRSARWIGDAVRGYVHAADIRDSLLDQLERLGRADPLPYQIPPLELALEALEAGRRMPGALGLGARFAVDDVELGTLRCGVEDARSTAFAHGRAPAEAG